MIVITGGLGFIGTHVARELIEAGEEVVVTRHHTSEVPPYLAPHLGSSLHVEPLDVNDIEGFSALLRDTKATSVVHLATPPRRRVAPAGEMRFAVGGLLNVLEACGRAGVGRITVASSVRVYGDPAVAPAREDQPLIVESTSPIQASKLAEEAVGTYLATAMDIDVVFLRIGIIFGPGYRTLLNVPSRLCHLAAGGLPRLGDHPDPLLGHPNDAWEICYVKDCARAVRVVVTAARREHRIYNVGSGELTTLAALVNAIAAKESQVSPSLRDPGRPAIWPGPAMSIERLKQEFGYRAEWDTKDAVADYIEWLQVHAY